MMTLSKRYNTSYSLQLGPTTGCNQLDTPSYNQVSTIQVGPETQRTDPRQRPEPQPQPQPQPEPEPQPPTTQELRQYLYDRGSLSDQELLRRLHAIEARDLRIEGMQEEIRFMQHHRAIRQLYIDSLKRMNDFLKSLNDQ